MNKSHTQAPNIKLALGVINDFMARELGYTRPVRKRRVVPARAMPSSPKIKAIEKYRKEHPSASLREAANVTGFWSDGKPR